jgi:hypothetical protein
MTLLLLASPHSMLLVSQQQQQQQEQELTLHRLQLCRSEQHIVQLAGASTVQESQHS